MAESEDVLYEVRDRVTIITLNIPDKLNALNGAQYLQLAKYMEEADKEENTLATIIQLTGRYFSAGANVADKKLSQMENPEQLFSHEYWLQNFVGRNVYLTDLFHNHKKVLVAALNGPVIGLSLALVALCDLVYCNDEDKVMMITPFSNLGLVAEGGLSATLFVRLGWSIASEALLLAKPIQGRTMNRLGFFNKTFTGEGLTTEQFNEEVYKDLSYKFEGLYEPSIFANKQLLKANREQLISSTNAREVVEGFQRWIQGVPQMRFVEIANKQRKHKM